MEQTESMGKPAFALDQLGQLFLQEAGILRMDPVPVQHPSRIRTFFAGAAQDLIKSRVAVSGQYLPLLDLTDTKTAGKAVKRSSHIAFTKRGALHCHYRPSFNLALSSSTRKNSV